MLNHRSSPFSAIVALVSGFVASLAFAVLPSAPAAAAPGGRVDLRQFPTRLFDSRNSPSFPAPKVTTAPLGHLSHVWILESDVAGTATVHPCGSQPGSIPSLVFERGEVVFGKFVGAGGCLTLSTTAHIVVDVLGDVSADPHAGGLQYVPLATPTVIFEARVLRSGVDVDLTLDAQPTDARAAVVLIEALDPTDIGGALLGACGRMIRADIGWTNDRAVAISYVALDTADYCLRIYGEATIRLTLLGFLSVDGPDPTRLPPTLTSPEQPIRLPGLRALTPVRLLDTRQPLGIPTARRIGAGETFELAIAQAAESTTAVALNVTVTDPAGEGYLTVFPCDQNRPKASNLNFVLGETVPNLVNVKLSITRTVCLYAQTATHLIVDLAGTFEADGGAGAHPVTPERLLDTRAAIGVGSIGKLEGGSVLVLQIAGRGGVPAAGTSAVTLNVTVTEPEGPGFLTVYPCDRERPTASNLNYLTGQTVPNLVAVRLSAAGTVCIFAQRTTHVIADLAAWFAVAEDDGYRELAPERLLDTREPIGVVTAGRLTAGEVIVLQVAGRGGVPPTGATAVTMNVTVTEPDADGFVTVYPCDAERPTVSNLNYVAGETVPNLVTVQLAADGTVCLFAQRSMHLIADVAGYFTEQTELRRTAVVTS
ncbi:MAG: hypothetical protein FD127_1860 [Acidimicrobiaceae bacterium]|jgi:hypothetical protein|nr:MAG: hypothetical protein FD127_1860 [Acidimicrobiaceae bacterium]